jgi:hypothetical protein
MPPDSAQIELASGVAEVRVGIERVIENARLQVHHHRRDDLHDVRAGVAGIPKGFQIGVTDLAAGLDGFARKLDAGVPLRGGSRSLQARMI